MENQIFRDISTELDLNGPILSFSQEPSGAACTSPSTVTFTGIATVGFGSVIGGTPENIGTLSYQWYETNVGQLSDGGNISGSGTQTLTLSNITSGQDDNRSFYVIANYTPSQLDYETGEPPNEPLTSSTVGIAITPNIEIIAQPTSKNVVANTEASFTVNSTLTNSGQGLSYQWYLDGVAETNRTKSVTVETSTTVASSHQYAWTSYATHALPSTATNIKTTLAAASGAGGGRDAGGDGSSGGSGRAGTFDLIAPQVQGETLTYNIGGRGSGGSSCGNCYGAGGNVSNGPAGAGSRGGKSGQTGWSGGGGGAGGASYVGDSSGQIIVAGGGGGGGGGSHKAPSPSTPSCGQDVSGLSFTASGAPVTVSSGYLTPESDHSGGDGGGGGGGGGGAPGGSAGNRGWDKNHGAYRGCGGYSKYNSNKATLSSQWTQVGDGYANLSYDSTSQVVSSVVRNTVISGVNTPTLTLKADWVGIQTAQCKISHLTATNSPLYTDVVTFAVVPTAQNNIVKVEEIGLSNNAGITEVNLNNDEYTFPTVPGISDDAGQQNVYSFYSPDKDMVVQLDLYGGKGDDKNGNSGGEGGYSRIQFTMTQNQEYVIAGLSTYINAPFVYRGASLIACVGAGGDAGNAGRGGFGAGVDVAGQAGRGAGSGDGGSNSTITSNGIFGSMYTESALYQGDSNADTVTGNGKTIICPKGVYWRQQGKAQCDSVGTTQFYLGNGTLVNNTGSITRGYKSGYNIIQTGGAAGGQSGGGGTPITYAGGAGGCGAEGGTGGTNGGGGGGSGWKDSVTVISTQLGGSTGDAKVVLRVVS